MSSWDRLSASALRKLQDRLVAEQVRHVVAPFSPYWKVRLAEVGRTAGSIDAVSSLATVPAVGERDVSPTGDPAGMARLVVQTTEGGYALHAKGPDLRRALRRRVSGGDAYRGVVAYDTKPTSYVWSGLGFRYPVASSRRDLDAVARAGARMWSVLGLTSGDALLSAIPPATTTDYVALSLAAMAAGAPAMFPGARPADLAAAARLAPPTVLALPSADAAALAAAVVAGGGADRLRMVLLVGAPTDAERAAVTGAVPATVRILAVHAPSAARLLWAECAEAGAGGGFHTYPDLDVVQVVDPETGESAATTGELVLTQLGLYGSALLRWRTGDLVGGAHVAGGVDAEPCPGCKRRVPRVVGVRRSALVLHSDDGRALDLRSVAGALSGRVDLLDWRLVIGHRSRDARGQVLVHIASSGEPGETAVGAASDIRDVAGLLPTQIIAGSADDIAGLEGEALTPRILLHR